MSAIEPLCYALGILTKNLSKEEKLLLEAELFLKICEEISNMFKSECTEYFCLMKFNLEMENIMIESDFIRLLIKDILISEVYNLSGIALYTQTPEDVIHDLILKPTCHPILMFPRKLIELHRFIRPNLYNSIIKKIIAEYKEPL